MQYNSLDCTHKYTPFQTRKYTKRSGNNAMLETDTIEQLAILGSSKNNNSTSFTQQQRTQLRTLHNESLDRGLDLNTN